MRRQKMTLDSIIKHITKRHQLKAVKCVKFGKWIQYALCDKLDILVTFQVSKEKEENNIRIEIDHINIKDSPLSTVRRINDVLELIEDAYQYGIK